MMVALVDQKYAATMLCYLLMFSTQCITMVKWALYKIIVIVTILSYVLVGYDNV